MAVFELNPHSLFFLFQSHPSSRRDEDLPPTSDLTGNNGLEVFSLFNVGMGDNSFRLNGSGIRQAVTLEW